MNGAIVGIEVGGGSLVGKDGGILLAVDVGTLDTKGGGILTSVEGLDAAVGGSLDSEGLEGSGGGKLGFGLNVVVVLFL